MDLEAAINRATKDLAVITEVVCIALSTRIGLLMIGVVLVPLIILASINSKCHRVIRSDSKFVEFLVALLLLQKTVYNGCIREVIHHQDINADLMILRIKFHRKLHDSMILLDPEHVFSQITRTTITSTSKNRIEIVQFIPQRFGFSKILNNSHVTGLSRSS